MAIKNKKRQVPDRPVWNELMIEELAQIVGKGVNEWCRDEISLEECIETAEKVLKWNLNEDGYTLAKEFEAEGFSPDSNLVDMLDDVVYLAHKIQDTHIKKWVIDNKLKLAFVENQKVLATLVRKGELECEITKLYPETMQYGVWYEGGNLEKSKSHVIVNFENVKILG